MTLFKLAPTPLQHVLYHGLVQELDAHLCHLRFWREGMNRVAASGGLTAFDLARARAEFSRYQTQARAKLRWARGLAKVEVNRLLSVLELDALHTYMRVAPAANDEDAMLALEPRYAELCAAVRRSVVAYPEEDAITAIDLWELRIPAMN